MSDRPLLWQRSPSARSARSFVVLAVWLSMNGALLHGQSHPELNTQSPSESEAQTVQMLLHRIEQLEADDQQLRARVGELERIQAGSAPVPSSSNSAAAPASATGVLDPPPAQIAPPQAALAHSTASSRSRTTGQSDMLEPDHMDVNKTLLNIRGFGDFGLYGGNQKGETTTFSLGQLNPLITSNISERFKVLTELVFEVHQNNDFEEDLERILLDYSFNDYFKLSAGRYHSSIGYYNTAFHHTSWFQTAITRLFIFAFEDEGGILPIHNVGVVASGQIPSRKLGLHYVAEVGNGRTSTENAAEPVQNFVDENNHKSLNMALFATPEAIPGSQFGFSAYRDVLYPTNSMRIGETIVDAYAVLSRHDFEWLNEALMIRHSPPGHACVRNTRVLFSDFAEIWDDASVFAIRIYQCLEPRAGVPPSGVAHRAERGDTL